MANTPADGIEPLLIVFEGGEGSGKSTVIERLFRDPEFKHLLFTREPGGTHVGERIREILKDVALHPVLWSQFDLFMSARAQLVSEVFVPAFAAGRVVLADRYVASTYAYQVYHALESEDQSWFMDFLRHRKLPLPGLVVWFDLEPEIGLSRRKSSGEVDGFDGQQIEYHRRVRNGFKHLFTTSHPWVQTVRRIDAAQDQEGVYRQVTQILRDYLRAVG